MANPFARLRATRERPTRSLGDIEDAYELTVAALAAALELRDDETGAHTHRVTELALDLTRHVDPVLADDPQLRYGFLLHDIGKIGIPDRVLAKKTPLTDAEREQLELHPVLGETLIKGIPYLADTAREVILHHHERWDGTGYPWGLAGTEIPLAARIFAICDAYDAMTNERPYRAARTHADALEEIRAGSGTQFDPDLTVAFATLLPVDPRLE